MIANSDNKRLDDSAVQARVIDWQERLNFLYGEIQKWLPDGHEFEIDTSGTVIMNEDLMRKFNVPAINLPTMRIKKDNETLLYLEPKGLWVIGANGRVDVYSKAGSYILVDLSERFAKKPDWQITVQFDPQYIEPFDKNMLIEILKASEDA